MLRRSIAPSGVRVEVFDGLQQADQQCGLLGAQVARGHVEIGARGRFDAKRVVAEGYEVEVAGENRVLVQRLVQVRGHAHLAQLAGDGLLGGGDGILGGFGVDKPQVVLHVLLVDGGRALLHPAGEQVGHHRAGEALHVHPVVLVEAPVLGGDEGVLGVLGNFLAGHLVAALVEQPRHRLAVDVGDRSHAGDVAVGEVGEVRLHCLRCARDSDTAEPRDGGEGGRDDEARREYGDEQFSERRES